MSKGLNGAEMLDDDDDDDDHDDVRVRGSYTSIMKTIRDAFCHPSSNFKYTRAF